MMKTKRMEKSQEKIRCRKRKQGIKEDKEKFEKGDEEEKEEEKEKKRKNTKIL